MHFAAKTQVLIGVPGQIMHALLFYKEKKTLSLLISCLSVFVPVHTRTHTVFHYCKCVSVCVCGDVFLMQPTLFGLENKKKCGIRGARLAIDLL